MTEDDLKGIDINKMIAEGRATERFLPLIPPAANPNDERQDEKQFMADVVRFARRAGWRTYHTHDSRKSEAGFPDLVMLRRGEMVVAELKVGKNKETPEQSDWLHDFWLVGVNCPLGIVLTYTWRPTDWPKIIEVLT